MTSGNSFQPRGSQYAGKGLTDVVYLLLLFDLSPSWHILDDQRDIGAG